MIIANFFIIQLHSGMIQNNDTNGSGDDVEMAGKKQWKRESVEGGSECGGTNPKQNNKCYIN